MISDPESDSQGFVLRSGLRGKILKWGFGAVAPTGKLIMKTTSLVLYGEWRLGQDRSTSLKHLLVVN
jgi:hypothetical protein